MRQIFSGLSALVVVLVLLPGSASAQSANEKIRAQVLAYHNKYAECDDKVEELAQDDVMVLDKQNSIARVPCFSGAYQRSYVFYMAQIYDVDEKPTVWRQNFVDTSDGKQFTGTDSLTSAEFDRENKVITAYYKSRGIGDCGGTSRHTWSPVSKQFFLSEAGYMPCCSRQSDEEYGSPKCKTFLKLQEEQDEEYPIIYQYKAR